MQQLVGLLYRNENEGVGKNLFDPSYLQTSYAFEKVRKCDCLFNYIASLPHYLKAYLFDRV